MNRQFEMEKVLKTLEKISKELHGNISVDTVY